MSDVSVRLERIDGIAFRVSAGSGHAVTIDGPPHIGGTDQGARPMELFLAALAGCAVVDVVHFLHKGRQVFTDFSVAVIGHRVDAVPATFDRIDLAFTLCGPVPIARFERAVALAIDKYCSVRAMLRDEVEVRWTVAVFPASD